MATFSFERDLLATLELVPLTVRRKLDLARVKLSLDGWQALSLADRRALVDLPVEDEASAAAFAAALEAAALRVDAKLSPIPDLGPPPWRTPRVPTPLRARLLELGARLDDATWSALDDDARFVLVHLVKRRRRDERLRAALVELGLLGA